MIVGHRPLARLSKAELFAYPDGTKEREWEFSRELMLRMLDKTSEDKPTEAEITAHYQRRYAGQWEDILARWRGGRLFEAQKYGWMTFLRVRGPEWRKDMEEFARVEGIAGLMRAEKTDEFLAMRALYQTRILPSLAARRQFLDEGDPSGNIIVAALRPEAKRRYWRWWREYNTLTLRYQWADDSGVAYDPRQFDPCKQAETMFE
jgi:hypothetical protein